MITAKVGLLGDRFTWRADRHEDLSDGMVSGKLHFERNVEKGDFTFESCTCFCGQPDGELIATVDRHGLYYPLVCCRSCGLMRANPRLSAESTKRFYNDLYRLVYRPDGGDPKKQFDSSIRWKNEVFDYVAKNSRFQYGIVLDVGCNFGTKLLPFKESGSEVYGVDFGETNLAFGRGKTGIKTLFHGGLERFLELGKKADLVIMSHVLEHMLDLEGELQKVRAAMKDNSLLFIALPGTFWWVENKCGGNIKYLLQNAHTYQFSLETLTYVLECCGFERVSGDEKIDSLFRISARKRLRQDIPTGEFSRVLEHLLSLERRYLPKYKVGRMLDALGIKNAVNRLRTCFRFRIF